MRTKILFFLAALSLTAGAATVEELFLAENTGVYNLLNRQARLIIVDNYKSGATVPVTNNMQGDSSRVVSLTDDEIVVMTSPSRKVQTRLLTSGRDSVLAVVETVYTPYPDSRITFYTTAWKQLPAEKRISPYPTSELLIKRDASDAALATLAITALPMLEMTLEGNRLVVKHCYKQQLGAEEWRQVESSLYPAVYYEIKGIKLKQIKTR